MSAVLVLYGKQNVIDFFFFTGHYINMATMPSAQYLRFVSGQLLLFAKFKVVSTLASNFLDAGLKRQ